ncbi:TPA: hypothetical protein ACWXNI_005148 [Escherichia coli]|uniref:Uncharacterized protein n=1 Tax=Escherichia coli TaxID=562 RepID=A0AAP6EBS6_ECOLX|nr:hypothetical protein [Escherichia coli]HBC2932047.1 hypothetical protein [Escherichia coli O146]EER9977437.1 hypothetical protein [Escherichia coli]EET3960304.1 hypothetical protein [Escherichia coli]EET9015763.1 hypothetical protein [Escherichia coli]EEX2588675.1 hypothetical protein [Escherichia coli]
MSDDKKIEFSTSDVLNALLHRQQNMQHLATQESVDNLRREIDGRFNSLQNQLISVDKRLDKLETKFDRLQWFIVAAALALIFKDYIFRIIGAQ